MPDVLFHYLLQFHLGVEALEVPVYVQVVHDAKCFDVFLSFILDNFGGRSLLIFGDGRQSLGGQGRTLKVGLLVGLLTVFLVVGCFCA